MFLLLRSREGTHVAVALPLILPPCHAFVPLQNAPNHSIVSPASPAERSGTPPPRAHVKQEETAVTFSVEHKFDRTVEFILELDRSGPSSCWAVYIDVAWATYAADSICLEDRVSVIS